MEAGDVTSLLEQFEASEVDSSSIVNEIEKPVQTEVKKKKKREILSIKEEVAELPPAKKRKSEKKIPKVNETVSKKPVKVQGNNQREVKKILPKEVIDRIQVINFFKKQHWTYIQLIKLNLIHWFSQ